MKSTHVTIGLILLTITIFVFISILLFEYRIPLKVILALLACYGVISYSIWDDLDNTNANDKKGNEKL